MHLWLDRCESPIGDILMAWDERGRLRVLDFADFEPRMRELLRFHYGDFLLESGSAPAAIVSPILRYFSGDLAALDAIEVATGGTPFQKSVWRALRDIPPGQTTSYGELAQRLGRRNAVRAVGGANGANPIGIVLPCHGVAGSGGALTGYGGGLPRKAWLLAHEARHTKMSQVDLFTES